MQDREKLLKLINLFEDLLLIKGNEWLIDAILEKIKNTSNIKDVSKSSLIQEIYELCIEEKIEKQAIEFYKDFKIESLRQQLIDDFKKMEHERRRDDFEGFCLCLYQQCEAIVNHLFSEFYNGNWTNFKGLKVILFKDKVTKEEKYKTLEQEVNGGSKGFGAFPKFKAVAFYYYFNKKTPLPFSYMSLKEVFYEIYQMRNKNHREGELYDFQSDILVRIQGQESKYYFKFYGFLEDFIRTINKNLHDQLPEEKKNVSEQSSQSLNTIGSNSLVLQELANKMKKEK